jgi:RimJ/RimL family protein N-acetyltransferase
VLEAPGRLADDFRVYGLDWDEEELQFDWGQGLATEASVACVQCGLQTLKLPRILGLVEPPNGRSVRVLERAGFSFEKMIDYRSQQVAQYVIEASGVVPQYTP